VSVPALKPSLLLIIITLSACAQAISPDAAREKSSGELIVKMQRYQSAAARDPENERYATNVSVMENEIESRFSSIVGMTKSQLLSHFAGWKPARSERVVTNEGTQEILSFTQEHTSGPFWPFRKHRSIPVALVTLKNDQVVAYQILSDAHSGLRGATLKEDAHFERPVPVIILKK